MGSGMKTTKSISSLALGSLAQQSHTTAHCEKITTHFFTAVFWSQYDRVGCSRQGVRVSCNTVHLEKLELSEVIDNSRLPKSNFSKLF